MGTKISVKIRHLILFGLFLLYAVPTPSVLAIGKPESIGRQEGILRKVITTQEEKRQQAQTRLTEAKLRACQAKENAIKKRSEHLGQLASTMEEKFDAIAKRVENYYTSIVVPSGKTVANYDSLVADIQTKKKAVQTALTQTQVNTASFACISDDPKRQITKFKDDMRVVKSALKDYRTSIKNLIVAIRSVTGKAERSNTSPKPAKAGGSNL